MINVLSTIADNSSRYPWWLRAVPVLPCLSLLFTVGERVAAEEHAAAKPIVQWEMQHREPSPRVLKAAGMRTVGDVRWGVSGPRPPEFPSHEGQNLAVELDGRGARIELLDEAQATALRFGNGDSITLAAWVKPNGVTGSPVYIIGKGRTGAAGFPKDNQNWALRLSTSQGVTRLSFLFATKPTPGVAHWHRWTSSIGFSPTDGWHHVAVSYRFGEPGSILAWIDGCRSSGEWDMGGATKRPPVVDEDAVWIGASQAGALGNSFRGSLDRVAVYRRLWSDEDGAAAFQRAGGPRIVAPTPEAMPEIGEIPKGQVLFTLAEGLPSHTRWLNSNESPPAETMRWLGREYLLPRLPQRYDAWGIRDARKSPVLLRVAADVSLPAGAQRLMLRARGLGRLWLDDKLIARTKAVTKQPPNGEEPVTPLVKPPLPGVRVAGYHQQEVLVDVTVSDQPTHRMVLELVVGGKSLRTETGETLVALRTADAASYDVIRPDGERGPLTDEVIVPWRLEIEERLQQLDDVARRALAAAQDDFWEHRHAAARRWAASHPAPTSPTGPAQASTSAADVLDAFIESKIQRVLARQAASSDAIKEASYFHERVLPILREHCFRCHGEKDQGGLQLNSRESALKAGESGLPAVVPGKLEDSEMWARITSDDESTRMPPTKTGLTKDQVDVLRTWIKTGAGWPDRPLRKQDVALTPIISDTAFLRRVYMDTVGTPPSSDAVRAFLKDRRTDKRTRMIDQLLADERFADRWVSHWMDMLAENPTLLNASLNSTGPFRWFLYDSLRDGKAFDRIVTELIMMRGGAHEGGSAGFGIAAENDAPMAAKGHILASAFLGIELQCARCHDSPYHSTTQRDLYSLAAMLERKQVRAPATSQVPAAFFTEKKSREALIQATLKPDESVEPLWPFGDVTGVGATDVMGSMRDPRDTREQLAALITAPQNSRFSRVVVNRVWQQLMGAGIVEPPHDWEGRIPSHPRLLDWLAHEFVEHNYDLRHVMRLIMRSDAYQREARDANRTAEPGVRFFHAPDRRRLTAEQIVDSLHHVTGNSMDVEELTFVHDGRRALSNRLTLGRPHRAWMFGDLKNERDRPSLSLPRARAVVDVLEAFGWTGSRQMPVTERELDANVLQPGVLANGALTSALTRAAFKSELAELAVAAESPSTLVDELFLRILTRYPSEQERIEFVDALTLEGTSSMFEQRLIAEKDISVPAAPPRLPLVTWFNHLRPEANTIQQEHERRVLAGPRPDPRLRTKWREAYEDVIWSLVNHREFVWLP